MSGPVSPSPRRIARSRPTKRFTLIQANRALTLVSRIVADVVRTHDRAMDIQAKLDHKLGGGKVMPAAAHAELDAAMDRLQDYVAELSTVGCELKDYRTGLVDFVGRHEGRDVMLCWRLGEERIHYWHEMNAGFAGRKPVSVLDERGEF
jgi:hypothetical protein